MSLKHEAIDVKVSRRILWVGSEAYPLHNIASARTHKWVPRRGVVLWHYVKSVVLWIVAGVIVAMVMSALDVSSALPFLVGVAVVIVLVLKTIRLVEFLKTTLYELVIETSGSSRTALASNNEKLVTDLVFRITDAINNPLAEFQVRVENFHVGDNINQFGDNNVGKVAK